ncbi:MAG: hypothetical protein RJB38_1506 [Pseudomonadota bacterium]
MGSVHVTELKSANNFHLKRIEVKITPFIDEKPSDEVVTGRLVLNDIGQEGLALYTPMLFELGTQVKIDIHHHENLSVVAKVGWCQHLIHLGKIMTNSSLPYRVGFVFEFDGAEDRARVQAFQTALAAVYPGLDLTRAPYAA